MTPEERAAGIWCTPYMASKEMDVELCLLVAAEIRQAVKEQKEFGRVITRLRVMLAYEDAARIAEKITLHMTDGKLEDEKLILECRANSRREIAKRIRARDKEI